MLKHEVFKNINFEGFEFINVDDGSNQESEINKRSKLICKENRSIIFLENKSRGVQISNSNFD
jgi:hypothetical protein